MTDPGAVPPTPPPGVPQAYPGGPQGWPGGPQAYPGGPQGWPGAPGGWPGMGGGPGGVQEAPEVRERQRLHPLSPLLHGAKSLAVIVAALSWQTLGRLGLEHFAIVVLVFAVGAVIFSAIGWWNTGYQVVGRELRISDGLLWRRNRAIPLDRLQAVELRRPLLAQLTGLAELRLEVVGGGKTEAPLAYLSVQHASELRERLLALSARTRNESGGDAGPAAAAATGTAHEHPLFRVRNQNLLISQLLTPQAFLLPVGVAWVVVQFVLEGSWTFIGIASTVTAMAGVLLQPIRRVLRDWSFRLARDTDGRLLVRYGLLETRSQAVPLHRVQSIRITWPLLWRGTHWLYMRLDVAGYAAPQQGNDAGSDRLLPVGDEATARALIGTVLPGTDLAVLATSPPPRRARWLHPVGLRFMGVGLAPQVLVTRHGWLTREMTLVPYARLQSVRVVQGPLQRLFRLATVYADAAGGRSGAARDRDLAEAWAIADQLAVRSRQARQAPSPAPAPQAGPPVTPAPFAGPYGTPVPLAPPPGPLHPTAGPATTGPATTGPATAGPAATGPATTGPAGEADDDAFWRRPAGS
ncbi:PH domain-containing protein [Actinoplanes sp. NPDC051851]|uniref:PH domain-containing protein n=1 Tax=Actinoplanes sp. NPDC051851 TaxID=3154753 RepID=UPI003434ACAB